MFSNNQEVVFLLPFSFPWSWYLGFEVQGCRCCFLASIYTNLISYRFQCFILLYNMFIAFSSISLLVSCFQHVLLFSKHVYQLFHMFSRFDVAGLGFLGQDMFEFLGCALCHVYVPLTTFMCLDLHVRVLLALFGCYAQYFLQFCVPLFMPLSCV